MADRKIQTTLVIRGDSKDAVRSLNLTEKELDKLVGKQRRASDVAQRYAKNFGGLVTQVTKYAAIAGGVAVAGTTAMIASQLKAIDTLAKTSDKLGIATEDLQALRFAAEQTGVSNDKLDMSLQRMTRRLAEAAQGGGEAKAAIEQLGLDAQKLARMAPDKAFAAIADAMQGVGTQGEKVRLAFKFFDSEGVALVNTLALGSEGLEEFARQAEVAGINISRIDAARIEQANDSINLAKQLFTGFAQQLTVRVAPVIADVASQIFNVAEETDGVGEVADRVFNHMVDALGSVADMFYRNEVRAANLKLQVLELGESVLALFNLSQRAAVAIGNILPGQDTDPSSIPSIQLQARIARDIAAARGELIALLGKDLPSERIEEYVAGVVRRSTEAARAGVAAVGDLDEATDGLVGSTGELNTETEKLLNRYVPLRQATERYHSALEDLDAIQGQISSAEYQAALEGIQEEYSKAAYEAVGLGKSTEKAKKETDKLREAADPLADAYEEALTRVDNAFVELWKSAGQGSEEFVESLKGTFTQLLAELAHQAITQPILVRFGMVGSNGGLQLPGGGSIGNLVSGLVGAGGDFLSLGKSIFGLGGNSMVAPGTAAGGLLKGLGGLATNPWTWGAAALLAGMQNDWWSDPDGYKRSNSGFFTAPTPGADPSRTFAVSPFSSGFAPTGFNRRGSIADANAVIDQFRFIDDVITGLVRENGGTLNLTGATLNGVNQDGVFGTAGTFLGVGGKTKNFQAQLDFFAQQLVDHIGGLSDEITQRLQGAQSVDQIVQILGELEQAYEGNQEAAEASQQAAEANQEAIEQVAAAEEQLVEARRTQADVLAELSDEWVDRAEAARDLMAQLRSDLGLQDDQVLTDIQRLASLRDEYIQAAADQERLEQELHQQRVDNYQAAIDLAEDLGNYTARLRGGTLAPGGGVLSQNWASWAGQASDLARLLAEDLGLDASDSNSEIARIADLRQQYIDAAEEQERMERELHEQKVRYYQESLSYAQQLAGITSALKTGNLSPLKGAGKLSEAGSFFNSLVSQANAGNSDALSQVGGAAQTYLQVARDYYASSQSYTDIFNQVTGTLGSLGVGLTTAQDPGEFSSSAGDVLREQLAGLNDELAALRGTFVDEGRSQFFDLAQRAANGDEDAVAQLSTVAEAYLEVARDMFGDGEQYTTAFEAVTSRLDSVAASIADVADPGEFASTVNEELREKLEGLRVELSGIQNAITDEAVAHLISIDQSLIDLPESLRAVLGDSISTSEAGRVWDQLMDSGLAPQSIADAIASDPALLRQVNSYLAASGQGQVADYQSAYNPDVTDQMILQAQQDFNNLGGPPEDRLKQFFEAAQQYGVGSTQIANAWNSANPDFMVTSQDINSLASGLGLPTFAKGGIATGPSIFGEAGPEAAVPLEDGAIPVRIYGSESQLVQKFDEWAGIWERMHGQLINIEDAVERSGQHIVDAVTGSGQAVTETIEREQQIARRVA